jgi:hypothetical protein
MQTGTLRLVEIEKRVEQGHVVLLGTLILEPRNQKYQVFFRYPEACQDLIAERPEPFVAAALLPCMKNGWDLQVDCALERNFSNRLGWLQDIWGVWSSETFQRIKVRAKQVDSPVTTGTRTGAFFSLGVDSFYTLLKNLTSEDSAQPPIDDLLYIKGCEAPLSAYRDGQDLPVRAVVEKVAQETGKRALFGETNIRDIFDLNWPDFYCGAGLASIALSLGQGFGQVIIPSSHSYRDLFPCGTHPLTDVLWSTSYTAIVHDGAEVDRAGKIERLVGRHPLALEHLRVCTKVNGGIEQCGRCSKCLRTMLVLTIMGNLEEAKTFPDCLPVDWARRLGDKTERKVAFIRQNLEMARRLKADNALLGELESAYRAASFKQVIRELPPALGWRRVFFRMLLR